MKQAAVLAVFALIAVVSATRPSIQWTEKCSKEFKISREMFDNFDPLVSEWHEGSKCYTRCELREQGILAGDSFNGAFTRAVSSQLQTGDAVTKVGAEVLSNCMRGATATEGCEKAYQFARCIAGTVVSADFLKGFVTKYV